MKQNLQDFINERAEHLAFVFLTRRQDLAVERIRADYGIDLLVTILQDRLLTGRIFGVEVKGRDQALKNIEKFSLSFTQQKISYFQDLPFPVCVFLFTMADDLGYYRWLKYPSCELDQTPHFIEQDQWHPLNENGIEQIVNSVNAWYDAKSHSAA